MKFTFAPESTPLEGYTIKRAIHRGGFGEVYYAISDSGKEVALKLLNNNLEIELRGVSQCLNLKHPNLVTIFDMRQDADGDHWIVMEYIGGRGLHEVLRDNPNGMAVKDVLHWLTGIRDGLSFLHDRGIVHRDLKPANVFSDQDVVKIGDVGLSKYISESRRSAQTQSVGTVYYMAPEVARGRYGKEVDIYALGVMLVEMLTGHVPFDGQTTAEILMKHMTADPDLSRLPPAIQPVINACLEKDPAQRIHDVNEVERRFRLALDGVTDADLKSSRESPRRAAAPPPAQPVQHTAGHKQSLARNATQSTFANRLAHGWNEMPAPAKWVIGGIVAILVLETGAIRIVATGGLLGGTVYFGHRLFLALFGRKPARKTSTKQASVAIPPARPATHSAEAALTVSTERSSTRHGRKHVHRRGRLLRASTLFDPTTPRKITGRQRLRDLMNSLSVSLAAVILVTLAVFLTTRMLPEATHAVYFGAVTLVAAWGLLATSKLSEGRSDRAVMRRTAQAGVGLIVGFAAAVLSDYLLLSEDPLLHAVDSPSEPWVIGRLMIADGSRYPTRTGFMLFFAGLFAARRWWWLSDSFRKTRFRVSSSLLTLLVGAVVGGLLPGFPVAIGATWALAIAAVIQLSAGWTPHEDRQRQLLTEREIRSSPTAETKHDAHPLDDESHDDAAAHSIRNDLNAPVVHR